MAGSSPLSKPSQGLQEIATWRPLLESSKQANAMYADVDPTADPFSTLLTMTVVPGLQSAVTNLWDPRDPEPMLVWLETWRDVLPTNIQLIILETLIFPKVLVTSSLSQFTGKLSPVFLEHGRCPKSSY